MFLVKFLQLNKWFYFIVGCINVALRQLFYKNMQ